MNTEYDLSYYPPIPFVDIQLARPDRAPSQRVIRAIIDTGADATIIPERHLRTLGLQVDGVKYLRSQWGARRPVDVYLVDLLLGEIRLPAVEVVADTISNESILGRNALNWLRINLDGPLHKITISD